MPNYPFYYSTATEKMSNVKRNITDNFRIIQPRNDITVIPAGGALPQSGNYNIGDRVFRDDPKDGVNWPSNYILVCKDANWGWHWRPVQHSISPWVSVPATAIDLTADYELHPTFKWQIALDSRGWCHWRGAIRNKVTGLPSGTSLAIIKNIPEGIRPNVNAMHTLSLTNIGSGTGKAGNVSGRIYVQNDGYSSFRFFNSSLAQVMWFDGFKYNNARNWYYGP